MKYYMVNNVLYIYTFLFVTNFFEFSHVIFYSILFIKKLSNVHARHYCCGDSTSENVQQHCFQEIFL